MKKGFKAVSVLLLTVMLILSFSGCSNETKTSETQQTESQNKNQTTDAQTEKEKTGIIAVCLPTMDNPLMLGIADAMKAAFPDLTVEVSSADGDPNTQATQIQNYIAMNVDMITVMTVEASTVVESLKEARAAGIKVFVNGTKLEEDAYDAMASVNQYLVGQYTSLMAKKWVDENYPDAAPGSIDTLILTSTASEDGVNRTNGLLSIGEAYRKNQNGEYVDDNNNVVDEKNKVDNPVYCPQLNILDSIDAEMFQAAQVATQNAFTSHPNIKLVITFTSDGASGAAQFIQDMGLSQAEIDSMAVFGCGLIGPEEGLLIDAAANGGVFRGATAFGGKNLPGDMAALAQKIYSGEGYEKDTWDPISMVYAENGAAVYTQVQNTGAVQAQ